MKKLLISIACCLVALSAAAHDNEVGVVVGGLNGFSYKCLVNPNFAVQADLAFGLLSTPFNTQVGPIRGEGVADFWDFTVNPNFLYNKNLPHNFSILAGAGLSLGMVELLDNFKSIENGKFGVNAFFATAYLLPSIPLSLSIDFKPGFAHGFNNYYRFNYFDWHLALGLRYCF